MKLAGIDRSGLIGFTCAQIANLVPDGQDAEVETLISKHIDEALSRLSTCIDAVRMWKPGEFNYLHSTQYCTYLYFLANTLWQHNESQATCTRLFLLNKALNGIDLFYEIEMPAIFFIGHSVGIVLAKATYGNYLTIYQNSTVGKNAGVAPVIGSGVVLYPNTAVIGRCQVGEHTVISQGTSIINRNTPGHCIAYPGVGGELVFKKPPKLFCEDFFRLP
jgi:serine O-acetyltransferase